GAEVGAAVDHGAGTDSLHDDGRVLAVEGAERLGLWRGEDRVAPAAPRGCAGVQFHRHELAADGAGVFQRLLLVLGEIRTQRAALLDLQVMRRRRIDLANAPALGQAHAGRRTRVPTARGVVAGEVRLDQRDAAAPDPRV